MFKQNKRFQKGGAKKINPQDIKPAQGDIRGADFINPGTHVTDGMRLQDLIVNPKQEIRERLHNNLYPYSYIDAPSRLLNTVLLNKKDSMFNIEENDKFSDPNLRARKAYFDKYLGYDYDKNEIGESKYKPTQSKDPNAKYYSSKSTEQDFPNALSEYSVNNQGAPKDVDELKHWMTNDSRITKNGNIQSVYSKNLGNYTSGVGEEGDKYYISYYDKWDINPFGKSDKDNGDASQGIGKPFELYGRVYYDKKTGKKIPQQEQGGFSQLGYKKNSPHKNRDFNIINSPSITMQDVTHPVLGISDSGEQRLMMPGEEHQFSGRQVLELPIKQSGGAISDKLKIQDSRTLSSWGEPLSKPRTGEYDRNVIKNIALAAQRQGNDPYTAIAVGMQESGLGTYTTENAQNNWGQVRHDKWDKDPAMQEQIKKNPDLNPEAVAMNYVLNKSLGKKTGNEAVDIQDYNGYLLKPNNDIGAKKMYGIDLTKYPKGYDLKKDPRYGNAVIDLRENVVKKNPELVDYINTLTKPNDKLKRISFVPDKNGYVAQLDGKPYGNQTFPDFASAKSFMTSNMDKFQQGGFQQLQKGQDLNYVPQFTNSILQAVATRVNNNRDQAYQQNNLTNPLNVIPQINNTNPYENYGVQQFQQGGQVQDDEESLQDFQDEDFLFSNDEEPAKQEQESPVDEQQAPEVPQEEEMPTIALDTSSFDDEEQQQGQEAFDKYDPGSYGAIPAGEGSKGNEGEAYNYLTQEKGIQPHIAAGIVGNLLAESGLNTGATGDSGLAKGIAQWHPDRQAGLMQFSRSTGKNPYDLKTQLDFVLHEAGQRGDLERIANTGTPSEAAYMFAKHYERPAKINPERMKYAEGVFNKYNKKS